MREKGSLGRSAPTPAAVLPQGFPEVVEEELVSVPDAKFTKGEFEVSTPCTVVGGTPGGGRGHVLVADWEEFSELLLLFPLPPHHISASHFTDEQTKAWGDHGG